MRGRKYERVDVAQPDPTRVAILLDGSGLRIEHVDRWVPVSSPYRVTKESAPASSASRPVVRYAASLEQALPTDVLALDAQGSVHPPAQMRLRRITVGAIFASVLAGCVWLVIHSPSASTRTIALVTGIIYALFGAFMLGIAVMGARSSRAIVLHKNGRAAEADVLASSVIARPILAAAYLPGARLTRAAIAASEGRHLDALDHYRAVRYTPPSKRPQAPANRAHVHVRALFGEIMTLSVLGKSGATMDEAKALYARAPHVIGDYLVLQRSLAGLSIAFTTNDPDFVSDAEAQKMLRYEAMAAGWSVLALAGWRAHRRGDEALANRLIAAELSKPRTAPISTTMPALAQWLDERELAATKPTS